MDISHLQNADLELLYQKYKGRIVLTGDTVNDDSGSHAVFTEQGSFVSQLTAARVMDVIVRPLDCAGQAAGLGILQPSRNRSREIVKDVNENAASSSPSVASK